MDSYYIFSERNYNSSPVQGCLIEFEDVLIDCLDGKLLAPKFNPNIHKFDLFGNFKNYFDVNIVSHRGISDRNILILVGCTIWTVKILDYIPSLSKNFDVICAYVSDPFLPADILSNWRYHKFIKLVKNLNYIFIPMTGSLEQFYETFQVPVAMVPMGCDVLKFGSYKRERFIDLMGYGRQLSAHSQIFEQAYNSPNSKRIYYYTSHMEIGKIHNFYEYRRLFWKLLTNSYIALAYDALIANPANRFNFSFVAQRWFECLAAGCVIIGRKPTCPEANLLLNWNDATIEVPDDTTSLIPFVEDILADQQRLQTISYHNYINALNLHDWRYRIVDILNHLELTQPKSLVLNLYNLRQKFEYCAPPSPISSNIDSCS